MFPCTDHVSLCVDASHILKGVPGGNLCVSGPVYAQSGIRCQLCAMLWKGNFGRYMLNSFFSSAAAATCAVFIAILASYVISRFHFRFKNVLLLFFLVTQMIPMFIMLAPLYQLLAKAKMLNDLRSLAMLYTNMMIPFSVVTLCGFLTACQNPWRRLPG